MIFPGLWEGLQLGNIHKHFALRCNEQIVAYLGHIYHVWDRIAGCDQSARRSVDTETVRKLQALAPEASAADRATICELMDQRQIFAEAHGSTLREGIKNRLLGLRTVIPTIRSFHENMKLFTILVKILRQYLIPHKPKAQLVAGLAEDWQRPQASVVEVREGVFHTTTSALSFSLAWQQMVLIALRNFPSLCNESPKQDGKDCMRANIQQSSVDALYRSAKLLGFSNRVIDEHLTSFAHGQDGRSVAAVSDSRVDVEVKLAKRRLGRPHARIFRQIQRVAFFPQLQATAPTGPTVAYIHRDLLSAFMTLAGCKTSEQPRVISIWGHSRGDRAAQLTSQEPDRPHIEPEPVQVRDLERHRGTQTDEVLPLCTAAEGVASYPGAIEEAEFAAEEEDEVVGSWRPLFDSTPSPIASQQLLSPAARSMDDRTVLQTPIRRTRPGTQRPSRFGRSLTGGPTLADVASRISVVTQSDASRSLLHTPPGFVHEATPLFRDSSRSLLSTPHQSLQLHRAAGGGRVALTDSASVLTRDASRSLLQTPERLSSGGRSSWTSESGHRRADPVASRDGWSAESEHLTISGPETPFTIASRMEEDGMVSIDLTPPATAPSLDYATLGLDSPANRSESERTILQTPLGSVHEWFSDSGSEYLV